MRGEVEVGDIIKFQVNRNITNLYKSFLILLEDLEYEHQAHFGKLADNLPDNLDILHQADYLTEEKMEYLRKRILDAGNHCAREINTALENCNLG